MSQQTYVMTNLDTDKELLLISNFPIKTSIRQYCLYNSHKWILCQDMSQQTYVMTNLDPEKILLFSVYPFRSNHQFDSIMCTATVVYY